MAKSKGLPIPSKKQPDPPRRNTDRPLAQMQHYDAKSGSLLLVPACAPLQQVRCYE
jgi:hypothetical protein